MPDFNKSQAQGYLRFIFILCDSVNLIVSGVKLWTVAGPELGRKEVESFALQQLDCVERTMLRALSC